MEDKKSPKVHYFAKIKKEFKKKRELIYMTINTPNRYKT